MLTVGAIAALGAALALRHLTEAATDALPG
jgi:hypothetical protein